MRVDTMSEDRMESAFTAVLDALPDAGLLNYSEAPKPTRRISCGPIST